MALALEMSTLKPSLQKKSDCNERSEGQLWRKAADQVQEKERTMTPSSRMNFLNSQPRKSYVRGARLPVTSLKALSTPGNEMSSPASSMTFLLYLVGSVRAMAEFSPMSCERER